MIERRTVLTPFALPRESEGVRRTLLTRRAVRPGNNDSISIQRTPSAESIAEVNADGRDFLPD